MKCKKCGRKQEMLFTSSCCKHCKIAYKLPKVKDLKVIEFCTTLYLNKDTNLIEEDFYIVANRKKENKSYTFYNDFFVEYYGTNFDQIQIDNSNFTRYSKLINSLKKQILSKKGK